MAPEPRSNAGGRRRPKEWDPASGTSGLLEIANGYMEEVWPSLSLPSEWLDDLHHFLPASLAGPANAARTQAHYLCWLPFNPRDTGRSDWDARNSYWVERFENDDDDRGTLLDRTAVLLACLGQRGPEGFVPYFAGQGLRLVMHVDEATAARPLAVRIAGMSNSLPRDGDPINTAGKNHEKRARPPREVPTREVDLPRGDPAAMELEWPVFTLDPVSKEGTGRAQELRPNRGLGKLGGSRDSTIKLSVLAARARGGSLMLESRWVCVTNSPYVDFDDKGRPKPRNEPKAVVVADVQSTTPKPDTFTAMNAFWHSRELFRRLKAYGFSPERLFRFAELPLLVRYRAALSGSVSQRGRAVNASAGWEEYPHYVHDDGKLKPGRMQIRFGLADAQVDASGGALGIACDPRWNWHEFSHVLLMGMVGERELPFTHSFGDGLAAIISDWNSRLTLEHGDGSPWRGVTFPWVRSLRRHDRDASKGWGWDGAMNQRERYFGGASRRGVAGYWAEQILSTTLFNLYRAIGGDARQSDGTPDGARRRAAGEYVIYLLVRATALLGPAEVVPTRSPDEFAWALIDADVGTRRPPPGTAPFYGGLVHKVTRWAFERQGLTAPASGIADVDIYIDDGRKGEYDFSVWSGAWPPAPPGMRIVTSQAGGGAAKTALHVSIGNRGPADALDIVVTLWVAPCRGAAPPAWDASTWKKLASRNVAAVPGNAAGRAPVECVFDVSHLESGTYALLASATCDADPSNIDPESGLPGAANASLQELVICDNNLACTITALNAKPPGR